MDPFDELKDAILQSLTGAPLSASGFYVVRCRVCNDHKDRAGWRLDSDCVVYSCFRGKCDATVVHQAGSHPTRKFRIVLDAFGIELPKSVIMSSLADKKSRPSYDTTLYEPNSYEDGEFPENCVLYNPGEYPEIRLWLLQQHGIEDGDGYLVCTSGAWKTRLIVPFFLHGKLIGYQGVYCGSNVHIQKYLKSSFNSDMLYSPRGRIPDEPILVEGIFDAASIPNGVATLQSTVSAKQAYHLRGKRPILLPDRKGSRYLEVAKKYGWRVCIPGWEDKDVNELMVRKGRLVAAQYIREGICRDIYTAELKYKLWSKKR